jgi:putative PIN family toxin of toxin-antitoxin system
LRAVADANVVVAAALNPFSTPRRVIDLLLRTRSSVRTASTIAEFEDVLARPYLSARLAPSDRASLLQRLGEPALSAVPKERIDACRDPKDNKYIEAALASEAEFVVTGDKDLLVLDRWRQIGLLPPCDFLAELDR